MRELEFLNLIYRHPKYEINLSSKPRSLFSCLEIEFS